MPRLVIPVATMNARVPKAPSTPDAVPQARMPGGDARLLQAGSTATVQDRAYQLVSGQRQQAGAIGDLCRATKRIPKPAPGDFAVEERSPSRRGPVGAYPGDPTPWCGRPARSPGTRRGYRSRSANPAVHRRPHRPAPAGPRPLRPRSERPGPSGPARAPGRGRCCRPPRQLRPGAPMRSPRRPG